MDDKDITKLHDERNDDSGKKKQIIFERYGVVVAIIGVVLGLPSLFHDDVPADKNSVTGSIYDQPNNQGTINNNIVVNNNADTDKEANNDREELIEKRARRLRVVVEDKRDATAYSCIPAQPFREKANLPSEWVEAEEKFNRGQGAILKKEYEVASQIFEEVYDLYDDVCIRYNTESPKN